MKVLCKLYQTCKYNKDCSHSKPHDIIQNKGYYSANNCILGIQHGLECDCSEKYLQIYQRKDKLDKLNLY